MWRLPLWTANVMPTKSGVMVERRDQVLIAGGREAPCRISSTFFSKCRSMNGPFFTERAIAFRFAPLPIADFGLWIAEQASRGFQSAIRNPQSAIRNSFTCLSRHSIFYVRLFLRFL